MHLSKHFTLHELTKSSTADRLGIDNTTSNLNIIDNLTVLCNEVLEPIRIYYGIPFSPGSGFRCLELNRILNSKDTSQHVLGQAVDIEIPIVDNYKLFIWCKYNIDFDQLILEYYIKDKPTSGWIHISYRSKVLNRNQVLILYKK